MANAASEPQLCLGFLSVVSIGGNAVIGGYLLLNVLGRPLEFNCTEVVRPNRAQEILYGPTLAPYLHADQLGRSLVQASKLAPRILFVDSEAALDLRVFVDVPVIGVRPSETPLSKSDFAVGSNVLTASRVSPSDRDLVMTGWKDTLESWNLLEPFSRVHEAIHEMRKAA